MRRFFKPRLHVLALGGWLVLVSHYLGWPGIGVATVSMLIGIYLNWVDEE